jgi:hypothetical protein
MRRLLAIGFIWLCCAGAWAILGSTLTVRSGRTYDGLSGAVRGLWGPPLEQAPPAATWQEARLVRRSEKRRDEEKGVDQLVEWTEQVTSPRALPLVRSDLSARLSLEHRRKGLLWFATYEVAFTGRYAFQNDGAEPREVEVLFPVEPGVTYDGFEVRGADGKPLQTVFDQGGARFRRRLAPGEEQPFEVAYRARGVQRWSYGAAGKGLGSEVGRARGFQLEVTTDFPEVDFPAGSLSPTAHQAEGGGWSGSWRFDQLVSTETVGIDLPQRLNPGPLAAKITFFAPVSLLFFFFVVGVMLAARRRSIHPVNYFLLACAFFAFHLLFAYLIDHLDVAPSFAVASLVSLGLVISYARLFVGWRTALTTFGLSQLIYLVLFSVSFFWDGFTGLSVTVGAILTLLVIMQLTGRLDWSEVLARPEPPRPPAAPLPTQAA